MQRKVLFINMLKRIKFFFNVLYKDLRMLLYRHLFKHSHIKKNKIIFNNFNGKGYGDNPKYIAEEILRQKLDYDLVWVVSGKCDVVPKTIRTVRRGCWREAYEFSTARIIVNNVKDPLPFIKKKGQFYIQTWHGSFALKYIEKEAEDKLSVRYIKESKKDSIITDIILSGSRMFSEIVRQSFWYTGEIYECGLPRDDIYYKSIADDVRILKRKYGIPENSCVLVYAPTFRDNNDITVYKQIQIEALLDCLENKTGTNWIAVIRLHPNVVSKNSLFQYGARIIDGSRWADPQELFLIGNMLITDYSSVMMDFSIMNKPVFLFIPDEDEYRRSRDLRSLFDILPYPRCKTNAELEDVIRIFDETVYLARVRSFMQDHYKNFSDGYASWRVVERIKQVIEG